MPLAWANKTSWTVLDTDWDDGRHFLDTWQAWQDDPHRPGMLHYVAVARAPVALTTDHPLAPALQQACYALLPGFQRITFAQGRVALTLCVGALQPMLAEVQGVADTARVAGPAAPWDKWTAKLLAQRCRRGTQLLVVQPHENLQADLTQAGFVMDTARAGRFDPRWHIATSRRGTPVAPPPVTRCAVIGAGLSGAGVAHALALRGWQVTVLDQHAAPAGGASGLPAGLVVPHVSADDNPRSRLSRSGTRMTLQHARALLQDGQDWAPSGVLECRTEAANVPPTGSWAQSGAAHVHTVAARDASWHAGLDLQHSLWHPHAAWIKPAALVAAWLATPGVRFQGRAQVQRLERAQGIWLLWGPDGLLAQAEVVVFANALACAPLLQALPAATGMSDSVRHTLNGLHAVHGSVSQGDWSGVPATALPPFPVNGHGSLLPRLPGTQGLHWLTGATFETDAVTLAQPEAQHQANYARLQTLLPAAAQVLAPAFAKGHVTQWSGTRCVTHDRLPLVGPLNPAEPSLWLCAGMGARGLSFAALCAELLAARLGGEPLPVEASLARSLDAQRVRRSRFKPFATSPVPGVD